jgi:hypothetical protein
MALPNNSRPKRSEAKALPSFQKLDLDKNVSALDLWLKEAKDAGVKEVWCRSSADKPALDQSEYKRKMMAEFHGQLRKEAEQQFNSR